MYYFSFVEVRQNAPTAAKLQGSKSGEKAMALTDIKMKTESKKVERQTIQAI
jgi:hypothetical protein